MEEGRRVGSSRPVRVSIRERSVLARLAAAALGSNTVAMTLGRTIHLHGVSRSEFLRHPGWVRHELQHVEQYRRLGTLRFLLLYALETMRKGYRGNRFEVEARASEELPRGGYEFNA